MATPLLQPSLAAGEIAPALYARFDLAKEHSGAALLLNWFVDYRGGVSTRPGTEFVGACKTVAVMKPRLIPFSVSTIASYIVEVGDLYMRFIADGAYIEVLGVPVELVSPYAAADIATLKYTQSADVMTITHPSYPVYNLTRVNATTFSLDLDVIGPSISAPGDMTITATGSAATNNLYGYIVTCVSASGEESIASNPAFILRDILNQTTGKTNSLVWPATTGAVSYNVYKNGPVPATSPGQTVFGYIGSAETTSFVDNNIAPDFSRVPPQFADPFSPGQLTQLEVTAAGAGYANVLYALTITGGGGSGAEGFAVCDPAAGTIIGAYLTRTGSGYTTPPTVSDGTGKGATYLAILGQLSGTYPAAPGYFQQRRLLGGTTNFPEAFVASRPGAYTNFDTSPISQDDDAITVSLASLQVNAIKAFTSMPTGLIVFTTGGGFLVSGGGSGAPITPANVSALPQASSGCNDLPPIPINYDVLYCQNRGAVVRDLAFNFYVQSYSGTDRSVLASHLFSGFTLKEWAYAEEPFRIVHLVRNDGTLLAFTYVPEQEIFAWTHYETNGMFRSVASIPEGQVNATYVIVERFVQGRWVYYVERFASGLFDNIYEAWCVDCGLALPDTKPAANLTPTGLSGAVQLVADANVFSVGDIGKVIWTGDAQATVTAYASATTVTVLTTFPFAALPDSDPPIPALIASGDWIMNAQVTTLSGLDHLDGLKVVAVADGNAIPAQTVVAGTITLPNPASRVVVGLAFTCDGQTLRLDAEGASPTVQGRRKQISAVTAIVNKSLGVAVGRSFARMFDMKDLVPLYPPKLISTQARTIFDGKWDKDGFVCFRQAYPLPASILGLIPEVLVGDTQR